MDKSFVQIIPLSTHLIFISDDIVFLKVIVFIPLEHIFLVYFIYNIWHVFFLTHKRISDKIRQESPSAQNNFF